MNALKSFLCLSILGSVSLFASLSFASPGLLLGVAISEGCLIMSTPGKEGNDKIDREVKKSCTKAGIDAVEAVEPGLELTPFGLFRAICKADSKVDEFGFKMRNCAITISKVLKNQMFTERILKCERIPYNRTAALWASAYMADQLKCFSHL